MRMSDEINHPDHYTQGSIECIHAIHAALGDDGFTDYCIGNVIKYAWRWRSKGGITDLHKARTYLDYAIAETETCP